VAVLNIWKRHDQPPKEVPIFETNHFFEWWRNHPSKSSKQSMIKNTNHFGQAKCPWSASSPLPRSSGWLSHSLAVAPMQAHGHVASCYSILRTIF
jgi:hypothetical protein